MPMPKVDPKKIKWEKVEPEKDKSFINFDDWRIGETIEGIFVAEKKGYYGKYFIIQKFDNEIVKINETTDLKKKMKKIQENDFIRITRLKDRKSPEPDRNDMLMFEVEKGTT